MSEYFFHKLKHIFQQRYNHARQRVALYPNDFVGD